jgi:asparagine synthase (glutamine-hydrolysing)
MCGITGFLDLSGTTSTADLQAQVKGMTDALAHRGPDGEGIWVDPSVGIALGNRRLSILDVSSAGRQPMSSACRRYVISTNGEIYNYRALRAELEGFGATFGGSGDTEVMLAAISAWGIDRAIEKLNGMFAFALWDRERRRLHLSRDRIGEKPLYYGWAGNVLLFGSELKALRCHPSFNPSIDRSALLLYARYCYVPAPYSIFSGISKVMAGTIVTFDAAGGQREPRIATYWSAREVAQRALTDPLRCSPQQAAEDLSALLADSVDLRMQSDRPIGAMLSGGIDSPTVAALMSRNRDREVWTFSIGFEEADEAPFARKIAEHLGTRHEEQYITATNALEIIPRMPALYDEPFADSSQIPTYFVSQLARRDVAVVLTGDGGDELFGGYHRYRLPPELEGGTDRDRLSMRDRIDFYLAGVSHWLNPGELVLNTVEPPTLVCDANQWIRADDPRDEMMFMDVMTYLPDDLLVKVDRASMSVGLEARAPFLDPRLLEYAWRLPFDFKVNGEVRKCILRQVLHRYVPQSLVDRPKQGFCVPLDMWLRNGLRDWAESLLNETRLRHEGLFDARIVRDEWARHLAGGSRWKYRLWAILMFQAWLETIDEPVACAAVA